MTEIIKSPLNNNNLDKVSFKAFDTVNHNILKSQLKDKVVRGCTLQWLKSCFPVRNKVASINRTKYEFIKVSCGAPQGFGLASPLRLHRSWLMLLKTGISPLCR